jgi:hypothetical protein
MMTFADMKRRNHKYHQQIGPERNVEESLQGLGHGSSGR